MKYFYYSIGTFFGFGKIPGAPGTWGSLAGAGCFYSLINPLSTTAVLVLWPWPWIFNWAYWLVLAAIFFLGVWVSTRMEEMLKQRDPSCVVIDEVCGVGVAMLGIPLQWPYIIMAVILFRIFDIWKPFPIRKTEKLPGGWGIMTDDLLAGLYANVWIQIGVFIVDMLQ
jgi:phosphatidylglycerophosphatase A